MTRPEDEFGSTFRVWASIVNSERNEGRGSDIEIGHFRTKVEALHFAKGKDVQGSDGRARERWAMYDQSERLWLLEKEIDLEESPEAIAFAAAVDKVRKP
jgi:hypothetical protein